MSYQAWRVVPVRERAPFLRVSRHPAARAGGRDAIAVRPAARVWYDAPFSAELHPRESPKRVVSA
ncbi:Glycine cleavage system H protein [Burkholderia cepacia]|nr:Glycine cleavage system H protein [Burkholderia cepacia]